MMVNEFFIKIDEVAFEFEDHNMKSGYVGFFSNSTSFVAYDKIYYEPLDC